MLIHSSRGPRAATLQRGLLVAGALVPAALGLVILLLSGCAVMNKPPPVDVAMPTSRLPDPIVAPSTATGAIFRQELYTPPFEDFRARHAGDVITVTIVEKISASQKSTSTIDKSGKVQADLTALPLIAPNSFGRASAAGSSSNSFAGKGTTESSNDFSGTITATVIDVLPNGHLMIAGEKQIGVNHNVDVLRFSGQVDPRSIQPGNTVTSAQIANVRLEHRSRGQQGDAQGIGWLAKFFLSVLPI